MYAFNLWFIQNAPDLCPGSNSSVMLDIYLRQDFIFNAPALVYFRKDNNVLIKLTRRMLVACLCSLLSQLSFKYLTRIWAASTLLHSVLPPFLFSLKFKILISAVGAFLRISVHSLSIHAFTITSKSNLSDVCFIRSTLRMKNNLGTTKEYMDFFRHEKDFWDIDEHRNIFNGFYYSFKIFFKVQSEWKRC